MHDAQPINSGDTPARLSYKFQRLRERLRQAILSGELSGKLPGERQLAERFNANAKTLSKALTDLAAEGLLERTIGRGTFVRGSDAPASARAQRWLLICDPGREASPLAGLLRQVMPDAHIATDAAQMRPSFLNPFTAVVDLSRGAPTAFLRDMVVRGVPVVVAGREPEIFSMHAVVVDSMLGASCIGRDLMTAGHTRFAAVERSGSTALQYALARTAERFGHDIAIERCAEDEVEAALHAGATALVCDGESAAMRVMNTLRKLEVNVPTQVSVAAVGCTGGEPPCSGYFVPASAMAEAIAGLIREPGRRPATLWLVGSAIDRGTTATRTAASAANPAKPDVALQRLAM
jgi:hypothetical protein